MKLSSVITASVKGTNAMSLFSYVTSYVYNKNFKEPDLLHKMIKRVAPNLDEESVKTAGWSLHYLAGVIFAIAYAELLERFNIKPNMLNGIIIGAASGIPAVMIWYAIFKLHPNPPKQKFSSYFLHLIAAHAVFGAFTFAGYKKVKN